MEKRTKVVSEHLQQLRKRAENASALGLTLGDWVATERGLESFQAKVRASFRPDAQEYVRHTILRTESEQLESDRGAIEAELATDTSAAYDPSPTSVEWVLFTIQL